MRQGTGPWLLSGLLAAASVAPLGSVAEAADVLPASGLVELLPVGRVVGDGQSEAQLHAILRTPAGAPIVGARLKVTAEAGTIGDVTEVGQGLYRMTFVPPAVDTPQAVRLTLRGRTTELGPVEDVLEVEVAPAQAGRIVVTPSVDVLTLGQDAGTTLSFTLPPGAEDAATPADLLVRTTSGEVVDLLPVGADRFVGRFVSPTVNYPHVALISVVDRRDPSRVWGSTALRLQGKVDYPVNAPTGATVLLTVGGREFGPVAADASGRALVPVIVPPGVTTGTLVTAQGGKVDESPLDLRVPPFRRVLLFDLPSTVPADARLGVPVRVKVVTPTGEPDVSAEFNLSATAGRLSEPLHAGDGVYVATYTPPSANTALSATLQASTPDGVEGDAIELSLIPGMPGSLTLTAEPTSLAAAGTGLEVFAKLQSTENVGLAGRALRVRAAGALLKGGVTDLKGGDYRASFTADQATDVFVQVVALAPASGNAAEHVVIVPSRPVVAPGGLQAVTIVSTDAFGHPVPGVAVRLVALSGGGKVPPTVTTDASGIAEIVYEAGTEPGIATLEARAGEAVASRSFWQAALPDAPALPLSGNAEQVAATAAWDAAQASVYVEREGGADAPIAVPDAADAGALTSLAITVEPAVVAAGTDVLVTIRALDAAGNAVQAGTVELFATGGARTGAVEALGGGVYTSTLSIPSDVTGTVKVNVVADGGEALSTIEIPVSAAAAVVADAPVIAEPVPERTRLPAIDRPDLRVKVAALVSSYSYEQSPEGDSGALLSTPLGWGGARGGAPTPVGVEAALRGFLPMVPYVGLDASFRWSRYAVSSSLFAEDAVDNLYAVRADVVARYPFAIGRDQLHVGLRAGFRYDDFVTFRGCLEAGCTVAYEPLPVPGLDAGLEIGAEFWRMYLVASASAGFAYATDPYAVNADLELGYDVTRHFLIALGFGYQRRDVGLQTEAGVLRGQLTDQQIIGTLGVGFSL